VAPVSTVQLWSLSRVCVRTSSQVSTVWRLSRSLDLQGYVVLTRAMLCRHSALCRSSVEPSHSCSTLSFSPTIGGGGISFYGCRSGRPSVRCPSVNTCFACHIISVLSGGISVKPATNIRHLSGHYWIGFEGHRSKVKVIILIIVCELYSYSPEGAISCLGVNAVMAEAYISTVWHRGLPVDYEVNFTC